MARTPEETQRWSEAVAAANIPTMLLVLVHLTGDRKWIEQPYQPTRAQGLSDNDTGGFSPEMQAEIRAAALDAILQWVDGEAFALELPSPDLLIEMMSVSLGEQIPLQYGPLLLEQLSRIAASTVGVALSASVTKVAAQPGEFQVLVVGAGMSGICAGVQLAERGIEYTIIEQHDEVGGTWLENRYPGCGVDVPSHLYEYSFAKNNWTHYFALRDEIFDYFRRVATDYGVRERIRFNTTMRRMTWLEDVQQWEVEIASSNGPEIVRAHAVITAVGAFNKPRLPSLPGLGSFAGPSAHTARWPETGIDVAGKRVAVIGTGASSMQVVPAIADKAAHVSVFQRTPQWAAQFEKFRVVVPEPVNFLLDALPIYGAWYRIRLSWAFNDRIHDSLQRDPNWGDPARSVNARNDGVRRGLTRYIETEVGDRTDLLPKVIPDYPPFGKRMLLDNGWYRALRRDNVELITESVTAVEPTGVVSESGRHVAADVLIWATGFDVVHFLAPLEIIGRTGRTLHEEWHGDDARAYFGTAAPEFPNLFFLYGPNTQFGHGGSLTGVIERQLHYVCDVLTKMREAGVSSVSVRRDVHDEYNRRVDAAHERMVWTHPGMDTYYRNSKGRVPVNNPFRIIDMWEWTKSADLADYDVVLSPANEALVEAMTGAI